MSDPEILGRPQYCSRKLKEEQKQNSSIHKESQKRPSDPDLEYERDEKDWWWCDDVLLSNYRIKSGQLKDKTPTISSEGLLFWWAHQDLNLGPKDYESRHPKKTIKISRGYNVSLSVCEYLCN
jgi:hypothetical protein